MKYLPIILLLGCTTNKPTITTLNGSKSSGAVKYEWKQIAGYEAKIYTPNEKVTRVNLPKIGVYVFKLWGENENGVSGLDTTIVRVK